MMDASYVGIDVSKRRLDVHIAASAEAFAVPRNDAGLAQLAQRLAGLTAPVVVLEATGGFENVVTAHLAAAGIAVVRVNPAQVRAFARALGQRAKTDAIDAALIARFAQATHPAQRALPDEETRLLADLVARRRQILDMMVAERLRRQHQANPRLRRSIDRLLAALEKEIAEIDTTLDDTIGGHPVWQAQEALLTSVPGVGPGTARTLLAELPELGRLNRHEVAALAGLAPWTRQSGQKHGRSQIGGGRTSVRSALFLAAMAASRHNKQLRAFRDRLVAAGKPRMVAIIAVARKLLVVLNAVMRTGQPWREDHAAAST